MHVAILWLVNERGEILLAQRAHHANSDASVWGPSVSGKVEPDETADQAAVREAEEELGIPASNLAAQFLHADHHDHSDGISRDFSVYYARLPENSREAFVLQPEEVASTKWVSLAELQRLLQEEAHTILVSDNAALWQRILTHLQPLTIQAKV